MSSPDRLQPPAPDRQRPYSVVVLISGSGSNLQALIDAAAEGGYSIRAVLSNRPAAFGLTRARDAGIATRTLSHTDFESREAFDAELSRLVDEFEPDLVVLAGFMRILSSLFVTRYLGRLINIHPSLLPDFPGINTHQRALDAGAKRHGVSVHFVTEELDGGPVIARRSIEVGREDSAESLAARVLEQEHLLYPAVVSWFASGELGMVNGEAVHASKLLPETVHSP